MRFQSQCLPVDTRGTSTCFEEFSKDRPCLCRRHEIASRYLGATPAKGEEDSLLFGLRLTDSNEAGPRQGLAALDTDKAILEPKTNSQSVTVSTKVNDGGMFGRTV